MCAPAAIPIASLAVSAIGTGFGVYQGYQNAQMQEQQAAIANRNAQQRMRMQQQQFAVQQQQQAQQLQMQYNQSVDQARYQQRQQLQQYAGQIRAQRAGLDSITIRSKTT